MFFFEIFTHSKNKVTNFLYQKKRCIYLHHFSLEWTDHSIMGTFDLCSLFFFSNWTFSMIVLFFLYVITFHCEKDICLTQCTNSMKLHKKWSQRKTVTNQLVHSLSITKHQVRNCISYKKQILFFIQKFWKDIFCNLLYWWHCEWLWYILT